MKKETKRKNKQPNIIKRFQNFKEYLIDIMPFALTGSTTLVISWYLFEYFNIFEYWFALPSLAGIVFILTFLIPAIALRFKEAYSIIATGIIILLIHVLPLISENDFQLRNNLAISICLLALVTEYILDKKIYLGDLFIDLLFGIIASIVIVAYIDNHVTVTITLVLYYVAVLYLSIWPKDLIKQFLANQTKKQNSKPNNNNENEVEV